MSGVNLRVKFWLITKSSDPESDVGETEVQEVLYKEEMTKRREETPAEKNRRKRLDQR